MFKVFVVAVLLGVALAEHIDKDAQTKSFVSDVSPDGQYNYGFETSNGISVQGAGNVEQASGSASWVAPEGEAVRFSYVADENGYQPTGDHIPPIPEHVVRALEWIRAHPQKEEVYKN
ncbi:unnamed protein product [Hermetia illucens]|uniref:Uncharacterized protein n=1 Tax=Hermetia illucens TaxID=343691 RepID=A0A7R8UL02_HERIL|nr:pupal cuticle protein Edg-78E-like [Hermetia illucens]CAD7082434.1 unnamed protein product [Hermetia illucens]